MDFSTIRGEDVAYLRLSTGDLVVNTADTSRSILTIGDAAWIRADGDDVSAGPLAHVVQVQFRAGRGPSV